MEWGYISLGTEVTSDRVQNTTVMTSHEYGSLARLSNRLEDKIIESQKSNLTILEVTHSHPGRYSDFPSGFYRWGEKVFNLVGIDIMLSLLKKVTQRIEFHLLFLSLMTIQILSITHSLLLKERLDYEN